MSGVPSHIPDHIYWSREPSRSQDRPQASRVFMCRLDHNVLFDRPCVWFRLGQCFTRSDHLLGAGGVRGQAAPEALRNLLQEDSVRVLLSCLTRAPALSPPPLPLSPSPLPLSSLPLQAILILSSSQILLILILPLFLSDSSDTSSLPSTSVSQPSSSSSQSSIPNTSSMFSFLYGLSGRHAADLSPSVLMSVAEMFLERVVDSPYSREM
ncbi:uncharacterized protein LOC115571521 [Sparus aurata]|uniref:uncharacterized protein LOC115571521 n=1 Tax=Sparus aurata TaxID=8175 RepID=UPI0011C1CDB6|nr:uncharacterized protein LOC115571521 [Sparus aurata]